MSVINQVLNQLEQRGARTAPEQTLVRAVPRARRNFTVPLLAFCLVLIVAIVAWQWAQQPRKLASASASITPQLAKSTRAPAETSPVEKPLAVLSPLASRLSFELSLMPLPTTPVQEARPVVTAAEKQLPAKKIMPVGNSQAPTKPAKPLPAPVAPPKTTVATLSPGDALSMKKISPVQQADAEFRKATALMQQGRNADALAGYEAALHLDAGHDAARQALVALLLENKRGAEAERVLLDRLKSKSDHTVFAMLLARMQFDRGAVEQATGTLKNSLPYAKQQADYQAFLAALLQRQNRNEEAITHYQIVTQLAPNNGVWQMGYGISLQAVRRNADAKTAFKKALDTRTLSAELQAFVQKKIKEL